MTFFDRLGVWLRGAPPSVHEQLRRRMRAVARGAVTTIGADTAGRLVGVVRADATLIAPLSGQPCVAYHLAFDGGEESATAPFELEDASGIVAIDPQGSWMTLDHRLPRFEGWAFELPDAVK